MSKFANVNDLAISLDPRVADLPSGGIDAFYTSMPRGCPDSSLQCV